MVIIYPDIYIYIATKKKTMVKSIQRKIFHCTQLWIDWIPPKLVGSLHGTPFSPSLHIPSGYVKIAIENGPFK